jgi:hypothetical protein
LPLAFLYLLEIQDFLEVLEDLDVQVPLVVHDFLLLPFLRGHQAHQGVQDLLFLLSIILIRLSQKLIQLNSKILKY